MIHEPLIYNAISRHPGHLPLVPHPHTPTGDASSSPRQQTDNRAVVAGRTATARRIYIPPPSPHRPCGPAFQFVSINRDQSLRVDYRRPSAGEICIGASLTPRGTLGRGRRRIGRGESGFWLRHFWRG